MIYTWSDDIEEQRLRVEDLYFNGRWWWRWDGHAFVPLGWRHKVWRYLVGTPQPPKSAR